MYDPFSPRFFSNRRDRAICLNLRRFCTCGRNSAYLSCRDNLRPGEILVARFCPECRPATTMLQDCGWVPEYDVDQGWGYFTVRGYQGAGYPGVNL
jgi:hypothetical protein